MDINEVEKRKGCGLISLSKLTVIKNQKIVEYILETPGKKFGRCTTCENYTSLRYMYPIGNKSHT